MENAYAQLIARYGTRIKEREPLAGYTTYKIGGPADLFYTANTTEELVDVVKTARGLGIPVFVLGGGSNILIGDLGFRGLVVKNNSNAITIRGMKGAMKGEDGQKTVYLEADAGVPMNRLVRFTLEEGLAGLEMHLGLPGSVGGAVFMNSKWMKPQGFVGDCVYQATILSPAGQMKSVGHDYFRFSYGMSVLQKEADILVSVVFALRQEDKEQLWERANESVKHRKASQPQGVRTAGCVFKNISPAQALEAGTPNHMTSAGFLLDKSGCKELSVGGASVSPVHANFITVSQGATAADVVELIDILRQRVKETFGVTLKEEILRIGEFA